MRTVLRRPTRALFLLGVSALALGWSPVEAQSPQGGTVAKGAARISQTTRQSTIRQTSQRAVIDWKSFDVGRSHKVVFDQPGKSSATLNRVNSVSKSVIRGAVTAPGTVIIQNSAGVIFTKGAKVDVGGLVATSQTVDAERFQRSGSLRIGGGDRPGARVINQGDVTIGETGLAALVGRNVQNAGAIIARTGTVALASGTRTTIDFGGDGAIQIAVRGDSKGGGVTNTGLIDAGGGRVVLTAGDAAAAIDHVINTTGVIRAASSSGSGGTIELTGRGTGKVRIGGAVSAAGKTGGGSISITGETVAVPKSARIDAGGGTDGGTVRIGGDLRGNGPLRRADFLDVAAGARISADGTAGAGGRIIAWSEDTTTFDGEISATGTTRGGFVETSGKSSLGVGPNARVATGAGGRWLLDPRDVTIVRPGGSNVSGGTTNPPNGSGVYTINADSIENALDAGSNVTITTEQNRRNDRGDILVQSALDWTGVGALRLVADQDVTIEQEVTTARGDFFALADDDVEIEAPVTSTGTANLVFESIGTIPYAGAEIRVRGNVEASGSGNIVMNARQGPVRFLGNASTNLLVRTNSGDLTISATARPNPVQEYERGSVIAERQSDLSGSNIQIHSASGAVAITATDRIDLTGGTGRSGKWVRVGRTDSSSDVTLTARDIAITGGDKSNNFAEAVAGSGGSLSLRADTITLQNNAGVGRVSAQAGADLSMLAETQTWNGPVQAGTDPVTGGDTEISGEITATVAPRFSLTEGRDFVMRATSPLGKPSSYTSALPLAVDTSGSGTIDVFGRVQASQVTFLSAARVGLGPNASVTGTGPDDAVVIAAGAEFRNEAGAASVRASDPAARWLVYIDRFAGLNGAAPGPRGYDLYNRPYEFNLPDSLAGISGNRIVYGEQPTLTITAESLSKTYGTAVTPGYAPPTGLRPGDSLTTALASGPSVTSPGAPAPAPAGSYATNVAATASDQGYRLVLVPGVLTVNKAALSVVVDDKSKTYGQANPPLTATYTGFVLGQDASVLGGALTTDATRTSDAGAYVITGDALTSTNYAIASTDGTMTVGKAALSVVVDDKSKTYGQANPPLTATYTGFVLGQDASVLGGALTTDATRTSDAGAYVITGDALTSTNYAIASTDGTMTVGKAALSVVVDDKSKTYGQANPPLTATYSGFVLGQDASVLGGALTTDATRTSDAGAYVITGDALTSTNYAIASTDGTMTVGKAALSVVVDDKSKTYGQANPPLTATYTGFVLGQDASVLGGALTTDATRTSDAGAYVITGDTLTSTNYAIASTDGTMTVGKAALSVVVDDKSKTYGQANPPLTATYTGFVLGQDASVLGGALTTDATRTSDAGAYVITGDTLTSTNYAIASTDGTMTVGKAALSVAANDATRPAGEPNPPFTATISGFVLGQSVDDLGGSLDFTTPATPASPEGAYGITPEGLGSGNYAIAYIDGVLTVTPGNVQPEVPDLFGIAGVIERFERGVPPLTPGDATFRTTITEAPPALADPFLLTYSLGEVVQYVPAGGAAPAGADPQGFVPAAGGLAEGGTADCSGPINRASDEAGCTRQAFAESFWTSRAEESR